MSLKAFYLNLVRLSKQLRAWIAQKFTSFRIQPRIIAIVTVFFSGLIIVLYFIPASQVFEGNLIVEEMSFNLDSQNSPDKLFLNSIRGLSKIEIEGKLKFNLLGTFEGSLKEIKNNNLEINLIADDSKLIIEPLDRKASQLELDKLRLQPETIVKQLNYDPSNSQLTLILKPGEKPNLLKLSLGEKPLKISLENYQLTQINKLISNLPNPLEIVFTPLATEFNLTLAEMSHLYIDLPNPTKLNTQEWILGNLTVKDVRFSRFIETENINDDLEVSTILKGKIRISDQNLEIDANQFLIPVPHQPGIQLLRQFQIHQEKPQGLEIRFRGQAKKIQAGIDPNFPVNSIQVNLLNKYFSREAVSALLAFCAAVIGALLPGLLTKD